MKQECVPIQSLCCVAVDPLLSKLEKRVASIDEIEHEVFRGVYFFKLIFLFEIRNTSLFLRHYGRNLYVVLVILLGCG